MFFFFSSRRRHTRCSRDWSSDVCSSDLVRADPFFRELFIHGMLDFLLLIVAANRRFLGLLVHQLAVYRNLQIGVVGFSALELILDRKSTRLNSSHGYISYAVFCLKKKITIMAE